MMHNLTPILTNFALDLWSREQIEILKYGITDSVQLEIKSPLDELKELNLNPLNDEPVVVEQSKRENYDGSMKPVTDFAGLFFS